MARRAARRSGGRSSPARGWSCPACPAWSDARTTRASRSTPCPTASAARSPLATAAGCWKAWPSCLPATPPPCPRSWPTCWPGALPAAAGGCATRSSAGRSPRPRRWGWSRSTPSPARDARCSPRPTGSSPRCGPRCPSRSTTCCCRPTSPPSRPGPLEAGLARELALVADVESAGGRHRLPFLRGLRSAARSTRGAARRICTRCSRPARPHRCRRGSPTSSTTSPAATDACAAARPRPSCAPTTRC